MFHQKILDFYHSPKIRLLAVLTSWSWRPRSLGWPATPSLASLRMNQAMAGKPVEASCGYDHGPMIVQDVWYVFVYIYMNSTNMLYMNGCRYPYIFFFVVHFRPRFSQVETWRWWSRTGTEAKKLGWVWHCRMRMGKFSLKLLENAGKYIYTYTNLENWGGKCVKIYKPGLLVIQR